MGFSNSNSTASAHNFHRQFHLIDKIQSLESETLIARKRGFHGVTRRTSDKQPRSQSLLIPPKSLKCQDIVTPRSKEESNRFDSASIQSRPPEVCNHGGNMSASLVTSEVRSSLTKVVTTFSIVNLVFVANKVATHEVCAGRVTKSIYDDNSVLVTLHLD